MSDLSRVYDGSTFGVGHAERVKMILATSAGKSMSEIQKAFFKAHKIASIQTAIKKIKKLNMVEHIVNEIEFRLYAFTLEDAKLATEAFVETMTKEAREKLPPLLEEFMNERKQKLQEYRKEMAGIKKKLVEKEPELKAAESAYRKFKNTDRYKILADTDADEKSQKSIAQMNEMLSMIDIELAGIREKLQIIEQFRDSGKFSKATLEKLEQMYVEQVVELRGTEGRKGAAIKLREQDKKFCDLYNAWTGLAFKASVLENDLESWEKKVRFCEEEMANPHPELLPPKVLRNKVTIYPLLPEE